MRKIVLYPDSVLRQKSDKVEAVDDQLLAEIEEIRTMLEDKDNGAGLAAPQVGILKRFFVTKEMKSRKAVTMINPEIIAGVGEKTFPVIRLEKGGEENFLEGCLSFPGIWGTAKRYLRIEAKWEVIKRGKLVEIRKTLVGFEAIVFQHETDHLDGALFVDRIKESDGKLYRQTGEKMEEISIGDFV